MVVLKKIAKLLLISITALLIINIILEKIYVPIDSKFGVTFFPGYAKYLNLDWQKTYLHLLDDLKVKNLRILTHWDLIAAESNKEDFSQVDYLLDEAGKRGARAVLVLGARQPRWPECHIPAWAKGLSIESRQQKTLEFVKKTVLRYKGHPAIWAWQVENEPFAYWFGSGCDKPDKNFLQEEINLVKSIDATRPVIVTDSGEWGSWIVAAKLSDILGVSLYRKSYNQIIRSYVTYPLPAWMYPVKSVLVKTLFAIKNQQTIISELQAEPWLKNGILETEIKKQSNMFSLKDFQDNIEYSKKTGFDTAYLWGAEWWYFMAANGYPEYLNFAKTLFN